LLSELSRKINLSALWQVIVRHQTVSHPVKVRYRQLVVLAPPKVNPVRI
jgi:hypothetical protein